LTEHHPDALPMGLAKVAGRLQQVVTTAVRDGVGPLTGAVAYAEDRLGRYTGQGQGRGRGEGNAPDLLEDRDPGAPGSPEAEKAIDRIVRESVLAAGTNGFVTGVGGFVTSIATLPANAVGNLIINARMVGATAHLRGYDLDDPHVQTVLTLVVAGSSPQSVASAVGVKLGKGAALGAIQAIPMSVLRAINRRASIALVAKYGTKKAAITLAKAVPWVGGLVGGTVDATLTRGVAAAAKMTFPASPQPSVS